MPPFDSQKHPFVEMLTNHTRNEVASAQYVLGKGVPCSVEEVDKTGTIVVVKIEMEQPDYVFPLITCPVYGPEWVRWPIQKGDKGVLFNASFGLGAMTGLGEGVARWAPVGNLGAGVFFPLGNTKFGETENAKAVVIYGPEGVVLKTGGGKAQSSAAAPAGPTTFLNVPAEGSEDEGGKLVVDKDAVTITGPGETSGKIVVEKAGVTIYMAGSEAGGYLEMTEGAFKFYVAGSLKFIIDAAGARYVGNLIPGAGGATYGINTTPTGTHIDNVNFLPHKHSNVQPGIADTGAVNILTSPALAANEDEEQP